MERVVIVRHGEPQLDEMVLFCLCHGLLRGGKCIEVEVGSTRLGLVRRRFLLNVRDGKFETFFGPGKLRPHHVTALCPHPGIELATMQDTVGVGQQKFDQEGDGIPTHMATFVLQ